MAPLCKGGWQIAKHFLRFVWGIVLSKNSNPSVKFACVARKFATSLYTREALAPLSRRSAAEGRRIIKVNNNLSQYRKSKKLPGQVFCPGKFGS